MWTSFWAISRICGDCIQTLAPMVQLLESQSTTRLVNPHTEIKRNDVMHGVKRGIVAIVEVGNRRWLHKSLQHKIGYSDSRIWQREIVQRDDVKMVTRGDIQRVKRE